MKNIEITTHHFHYYLNSLGWITIGSDNTHLTLLQFARLDIPHAIFGTDLIIEQTIEQLNEYLDNKRLQFNIPIRLEVSKSHISVLKQIQAINYGNTMTYKQIAEQINSKAYRYIGTCCKKNPILIVIPCHRVVSKNNPFAYVAGSKIKQTLLSLETKNRLGS